MEQQMQQEFFNKKSDAFPSLRKIQYKRNNHHLQPVPGEVLAPNAIPLQLLIVCLLFVIIGTRELAVRKS
jgi:hypothetical protein